MGHISQNRLAIARLILSEGVRRAATHMRKQRLAMGWARPPVPPYLVTLLPDRRITDTESAKHILAGQFNLGGHIFDLGTTAPFKTLGEAKGATRLHGFRWLRHLAALHNPMGDQMALHLVNQWIDQCANKMGLRSYSPTALANRITCWSQNAGTILQQADPVFQRKFIRTLVDEMQTLRGKVSLLPADAPRLHGRIAIAQASLALDLSPTRIKYALQRLAEDCVEQILPDGGHISRNPQVLIDLLIELGALLENCNALGVSPPTALLHAMDRMAPTLAMFIHTDGELASFNGVGYAPPESLALAQRLYKTSQTPTRHAAFSGYERMEEGTTTIIADVGNPPPVEISRRAHAGTLSFEMSSGRHRYIVNVGVDHFGPLKYREISRQTAAHCTAVINDHSSSSFSTSKKLTQWFGTALTTGPSTARFKLQDDAVMQSFRAAHNGYARNFGIIHEREMKLEEGGDLITGIDRFFDPKGKPTTKERLNITIRFHLHPDINPILDGEGHIMLTADRDDSWVFECKDAEPQVVQSIYFGGLKGARTTQCIALSIDPKGTPEITWQLRRTGIGKWSRP